MALMTEILPTASLPKLLALNQKNDKLDEWIKYTCQVAGSTFSASTDPKGSGRISRGRSEFILRSTLDRFKTPEGREECRVSGILWDFLDHLVGVLPTSTIARLLQSCQFMTNLKSYLQEVLESKPPFSSRDSKKTTLSMKRKRGEQGPEYSQTTESRALLGFSQFLKRIIALSRTEIDTNSRSYIESVLRLSAVEAGGLLGLWMRCLDAMTNTSEIPATREAEMYSPFLHLWQFRSRENDDDTGASPRVFASSCLVPAVKLLAKLQSIYPATSRPSKGELEKALEQLIAQHIFIPARLGFNSVQSTKRSDLARAQSALREYVEPLRLEISAQVDAGLDKYVLINILPTLLELAIRLCSTSTPTQKLAIAPWIEGVFGLLSNCAREPIPHDSAATTSTCVKFSPLQSFFRVLQKQKFDLSPEFLESILIGYSGLTGLRKDDYPLRLDIVAGLLELNGRFFIKRANEPASINGISLDATRSMHSRNVEALVSSLSEVKWDQNKVTNAKSNASPTISVENPKTVVDRVLRPLLQAYSASRLLTSFTSLWFWEARRHWTAIGTAEEERIPWLSQGLLQCFRTEFEGSMASNHINELFIEFILPVKLLLDEYAKAPLVNWTDHPSCAPACAAFIILEAMMYGIDKEETFQHDLMAWNAIKELALRYSRLNLEGFPSASRVWSILSRVHKLSYWVEGKETFFITQKEMIGKDATFINAVAIAKLDTDIGRRKEVLEAYRFVLTVCSYELDKSLLPGSRAIILDANKNFLVSLEALPASSNAIIKANREDIYRLRETIVFMLQNPSILLVSGSQKSQAIIQALFLFASEEEDGGEQDEVRLIDLLRALVATVEKGSKEPLEGLLNVLVDAVCLEARSPAQHNLALNILLSIPATIIHRKKREAVIDNIIGMRLARKPGGASEDAINLVIKSINLLVRLFEVPNPTAQLCIDAEQICILASYFDEKVLAETIDLARLQMIDRLFKAVMRQALVDSTLERREQYDKMIAGNFKKLIADGSELDLFRRKPITTLLLAHWLVATKEAQSKVDVLKLLNAIISAAENVVDDAIDHVVHDWIVYRATAMLIHTYDTDTTAITRVIHFLRERPATSKSASASPGQPSKQPISSFLLNIYVDRSLNLIQVSEAVSEILKENPSTQDYSSTLKAFESRLKTSNSEQKRSLAIKLLEEGECQNVHMFQVLIRSLSSEEIASLKDSIDFLAKICSTAVDCSQNSRPGGCLICINIVLREKPELVTQHGIDTLLTTLAHLASPQAPAFESRAGEDLYDRLCQTANSIVLLHRMKLGGRMHLMMLLLQNLMTCLFTPHRYSQTSLPPWLAKAKLGIRQVEAYSRILRTFCSPTVSSAAARHGSNELVDATKKAKEYAGQYVPYLLLHYCTLQLQAKMSPELKEKLKSGLWAVMDVVDIEAMRGMNAGMGRDERAIWASLYSEWQRFGRFKLA